MTEISGPAAEVVSPIELRPTYIGVDLSALESNFQLLRELVKPGRLMPIVKANAYGHGLVRCAKHLARAGADYLGVAFVEEGIQIRQAGITTPILVLGGVFGNQVQYFIDYDLDITASSIEKLSAIEAVAASLGKTARVHLKVDTGLERIGTHYYSAERYFEHAVSLKHVKVAGVYSHFASVKQPDLAFARLQLERFLEALQFFERRSIQMPLRHLSGSGGILQLPEAHLDMVRPGISLYGVMPAAHLEGKFNFKPVLSLHSKVVFFKVVKKGAGVSYGHTWHAPSDSRVVTIPVGYGDGYSIRLGNKGSMLVRGNRYPIVGAVCMDQTMLNIGSGTAYVDDPVTLIGAQGEERITVNDLARTLEVTPHEILVSLNLRLPRHYTP